MPDEMGNNSSEGFSPPPPVVSTLNPTIGERLLTRVLSVTPNTTNHEVFHWFERDDSLLAIAVVEDGRPLGLINRYVMIDAFARPFRHELFGQKPCTFFMDAEPLVVEMSTTLHDLSRQIVEGAPRHLSNGFIVTLDGQYVGLGSGRDLIREITELQIRSARYANPLTQLPGNVPINERIDALLQVSNTFCVCYFDLDHFKPFNDVYGFSRGDQVIQLTAELLVEFSDPRQDFVGHIGGDDFIVLFLSPDWEARCRAMLATFGERIGNFFDADDLARGGYVSENRCGDQEFHPLTSLSIGALMISPGMFNSYREVAQVTAEVKKAAKSIPGSSLVVNHRGYREGCC
ncbi:MAG: GGDEF domain-containing protein [Pseudomonadota bacterium]